MLFRLDELDVEILNVGIKYVEFIVLFVITLLCFLYF